MYIVDLTLGTVELRRPSKEEYATLCELYAYGDFVGVTPLWWDWLAAHLVVRFNGKPTPAFHTDRLPEHDRLRLADAVKKLTSDIGGRCVVCAIATDLPDTIICPACEAAGWRLPTAQSFPFLQELKITQRMGSSRWAYKSGEVAALDNSGNLLKVRY